jgi:uncharacterized membrane protein YjdF
MYHFVRIITIILFGYGIVGIFINRSDGSQIGDYTFISINALGLFLLSLVPGFIRKKWSITLPDVSLKIYLIFVTCALLLGEIGRFFENVPWWDSALHLISGSLIGIIGFSLVSLLNNQESESFKLSPIFVALFVFCFSLAVGVLWEIVEFGIDAFAGSNMQRFKDNFGVGFVGRAALADTMKDFILNTIGATFISILGYIDLKRDLGLIEKMALKKYEKENLIKMQEKA